MKYSSSVKYSIIGVSLFSLIVAIRYIVETTHKYFIQIYLQFASVKYPYTVLSGNPLKELP